MIKNGTDVWASRFLGVLSEILSAIVPECLINIQGPEFVGFSYKSRLLTSEIHSLFAIPTDSIGNPVKATTSKMEMEKNPRSRSSELLGTRNMELEQRNMYQKELVSRKFFAADGLRPFSLIPMDRTKGTFQSHKMKLGPFFSQPEKREEFIFAF